MEQVRKRKLWGEGNEPLPSAAEVILNAVQHGRVRLLPPIHLPAPETCPVVSMSRKTIDRVNRLDAYLRSRRTARGVRVEDVYWWLRHEGLVPERAHTWLASVYVGVCARGLVEYGDGYLWPDIPPRSFLPRRVAQRGRRPSWR